MKKINNLYQFIRELKEKKGHRLKIICDWDEVLKSREATVYHIISNRTGSFAEFFQRFWESVSVEYQGHMCKIINTNLEEVEKIRKKNPEEFQRRAKEISGVDPSLYEESPWLSIAQDLLRALEEDLVESFIITGNYKKNRAVKIASTDDVLGADPRKRRKFQQSFAKFPNAKLEINIPIHTPQGEIQLSRPEWIKSKHPDFDLFVDDNPNNILGTRVLFASDIDKAYILPNYETNKNAQGENIFRVPVCPTILKDEDFVYHGKFRLSSKESNERVEQIQSVDIKGEVDQQQPQILQPTNLPPKP